MKIQELIKQFNDRHIGIAYLYPRKHMVAINGGRRITESEAIKYLEARLTKNPCYCDYIFHAEGC